MRTIVSSVVIAILVSSCALFEQTSDSIPEEPPPLTGAAVATTVLTPAATIVTPPTVEPPHPEIEQPATLATATRADDDAIRHLCAAIGAKLASVSTADCLDQHLVHGTLTPQQHSLAYKDYAPLASVVPLGRVLIIGGIHGDELSSVSIVFKWMHILNQNHSGLFHWRIVPSANPDGLLMPTSRRQNYNGVDLNRNFPTDDWADRAHAWWAADAGRNPRQHPGPASASEVETRWLVSQIHEFKPDVIIAVHAPHHLVDYDGPPTAPKRLGSLSLRPLGVYPGSLGNFAGLDLNLPVVTIELQSAGVMPSTADIDRMWVDLVAWLKSQLTARDQASARPQAAE